MTELAKPEYRNLDPKWDREDEAVVGRAIGRISGEYLRPLLERFVNFGALDSEPRGIAAQALVNVAKDKYGITGWTSLGEWA